MATTTKTRKPARKPLTEAEKAKRTEARKARMAAMEAAAELAEQGDFGDDVDPAAIEKAFASLTSHYSEGNAALILAQAAMLGLEVRGLQDVGGYGAFQDRGRQVRKGERQSIFIWARVERRTDEVAEGEKVVETTGEDGKKVRHIYVPQGIFHISQTDPK